MTILQKLPQNFPFHFPARLMLVLYLLGIILLCTQSGVAEFSRSTTGGASIPNDIIQNYGGAGQFVAMVIDYSAHLGGLRIDSYGEVSGAPIYSSIGGGNYSAATYIWMDQYTWIGNPALAPQVTYSALLYGSGSLTASGYIEDSIWPLEHGLARGKGTAAANGSLPNGLSNGGSISNIGGEVNLFSTTGFSANIAGGAVSGGFTVSGSPGIDSFDRSGILSYNHTPTVVVPGGGTHAILVTGSIKPHIRVTMTGGSTLNHVTSRTDVDLGILSLGCFFSWVTSE